MTGSPTRAAGENPASTLLTQDPDEDDALLNTFAHRSIGPRMPFENSIVFATGLWCGRKAMS